MHHFAAEASHAHHGFASNTLSAPNSRQSSRNVYITGIMLNRPCFAFSQLINLGGGWKAHDLGSYSILAKHHEVTDIIYILSFTLSSLLPELMQSLTDATCGLSPKTTNISPPAPNAPGPDPLTLIAPFVIKALVAVYPSLLTIAVEAALAICAAMGAIPHTPPSTTYLLTNAHPARMSAIIAMIILLRLLRKHILACLKGGDFITGRVQMAMLIVHHTCFHSSLPFNSTLCLFRTLS
ncbi:uncharacterized protein LACBIDRAFT_322481 [Laccaria bicolor S238N-H82]|uniref:Predicted protein n=1 Tax=Laccaria bicolor (strain S238N-H82 / ATCC MYA-4686) TaxID=486041 RepID=B0CWG1_LACBS|nr:uncharacterized protein LACBIDRAFT_322481 [Laccaria bicolor S238N-H82]EDR13502.1 predicted protein [Laccaria bicolor S238N-H82]|eukprot:XP_001876000.1 predicted protein [Laccaria bicolor S238N-H82]